MNLIQLVIAYAILVGVIAWLATRRGYCQKCHHHLNKCQCCRHEDCYPVRWTQDGWTMICKRCGEWLYLGDDFDDRPDAAETYEPTRKD